MFAGYFLTEPAPPGLEVSLAIPPVFGTPDQQGRFDGQGVALIEQRRFNGAASRDRQVPLLCPRTGVALAFWGRLDNRPELISRLQDQGVADTDTDAALVLAAWHCWGKALPTYLLGDFSLALYSPHPRRLFLARDPIGVKPLYYCQMPGGLVFATSVAILRSLAGLSLSPSPDWIARYLVGLSMSDRHTAYQEVVKLPPGHSLVAESPNQTQVQCYHHWRDDAPPSSRRHPRWVEAYRAILEESIRCRMDSDFPLGTENSGGLDSATVTAYLAYFLEEPGDRLHSFGFATHEQEPALILETSQVRRITHNYIFTAGGGGQSIDDHIDRVLGVLGYPEEHGTGSGHTPFYRECQLRNIRTLFSGFGGDEVVTNSGHLLLYELLDRGDYSNLWCFLRGNPLWRSLRLTKIMTVGRQSPAYKTTFLAAWQARWPYQLLRPEVVDQLNLHHEYMETARYDAPYRRINDFIIQGLLTKPYIGTRLENCTLMAASHGIDYRWPLWDIRLVQQYLSTPSLEKAGPQGLGRYLHRRAIDGVVPHRVAWKPKDVGPSVLPANSNGGGLAALAQETQQWEGDLHPTLAALVDRPKLHQQIELATQGHGDAAFALSFSRGIGALYWLDRWLKGMS